MPPWLPSSVLSRHPLEAPSGNRCQEQFQCRAWGGGRHRHSRSSSRSHRSGTGRERQALGCQQAVGHRFMLRQTGSLPRNPKDSSLGLVSLDDVWRVTDSAILRGWKWLSHSRVLSPGAVLPIPRAAPEPALPWTLAGHPCRGADRLCFSSTPTREQVTNSSPGPLLQRVLESQNCSGWKRSFRSESSCEETEPRPPLTSLPAQCGSPDTDS